MRRNLIASISLENEENNLDSLVDNLVKEDKRFEVKSESNNIFKHVLNKGSQNERTNELHERSDEQSTGDEENIVEANIGEERTDESGSTGDEQPDDSGNEETGDSGEQSDDSTDSTDSDQTRESANSEDSTEENTDGEGESSSDEEDDSQDNSQDESGESDSKQSEESSDSEESEEDNSNTEDESETEESDDNEEETTESEDLEEESEEESEDDEDENIVVKASKELEEDDSTEDDSDDEENPTLSPEEAKQNIDKGISIIDEEIDLSKTLVNTDEIKSIDVDLKGLDKDQSMIKEAELVSDKMANVARMVATEYPSDEKEDVKESLESFKTIALSALATEFRYITNKEISIETISEAVVEPEKSSDLKEEANTATIESQLDKALGLIRDWNKFCQTYIEQTKGVYSKIKKTKQFKEGLIFKNDKIFSVLKRENKLNDPYISFNIGKEAIKNLLQSLKEGLNNCSSINDVTNIELVVPDNGEEKTVLPGDFILKKTELGIALIQDNEASESKDVEMKAITVEQMEKLLIKTSNNATETIDIYDAIKNILEKLSENISQPNMQIAMLVSEKITNVIKTCNDYLHNLTIGALAYIEHSIPLPEEGEEEEDDTDGLDDDSSTEEESTEETPEEGETESEEETTEDETSEEESEEEDSEKEETEESEEKEEESEDE